MQSIKLHIVAYCLLAGITFCYQSAVAEDDTPTWKVLKLIDSDGFSFRLRYLTKASLADIHWLVLELENRDSNWTVVEGVNFFIDYSSSTGSGRLANLGSPEVFPQDFETVPVTVHQLERGRTQVVGAPISNQAAGSLGLAPESGETITGTVNLWVDIRSSPPTNSLKLHTPRGGIPFTFKWVRPAEADTDRMVESLRDWLAIPHDRKPKYDDYDYFVHRLFEVPQVTNHFSTEELANIIVTGPLPTFARAAAEKALYLRDPTNAVVLDWYRKHLPGDRHLLKDLSQSPFWTADFAERLIELLSNAKEPADIKDIALNLLLRHSVDWKANPQWAEIVARATQDRGWRIWQRQVGRIMGEIGWLIAILVVTISTASFIWVSRRRQARRDRGGSPAGVAGTGHD